ncbi:MAG: Sec-independent protein translocase protein TatB [Polycyclovorans sp.]
MLDFSFAEIAIVLVIALVVLGPEKLPRAARGLGRWVGTAKGYLRNLTAELDRETRASDLRRELEEAHRLLKEKAGEAESGLRGEMTQIKDRVTPHKPLRDGASGDAAEAPPAADKNQAP